MSQRTDRGESRANYLRSPSALFRLRLFGETVHRLIGERVYLVGSVLERPDFRDVDLRIMLDDDEFERAFGGDGLWVTNGSLTLANMALSAMAREMTGLDIDCQIQRTSDANTVYGKHKRQPLILPHTQPFIAVGEPRGGA